MSDDGTERVPLATEPLSDAELEYVRSQIDTMRLAQSRGVRLKPAENVASRLLATLDACQSQQPVGTSVGISASDDAVSRTKSA